MGQAITFDGTDMWQGKPYVVTDIINIWKEYNPRIEIVDRAVHGGTGELLERKGNRCKVRHGDNVGFVTFWFIKELKQDWLEERKDNGLL